MCGRCLYTKLERGTTTVYPKLDQYDGKFKTEIFEKDGVEVNPLKYLNVKCNARAAICVEGKLIGDKINLLLKVREVGPSAPSERKRLLSSAKRRLLGNNNEGVKTPANGSVKRETSHRDSCTSDFCGWKGWTCSSCSN